jgi:hypothetical protein
MLLGLKHARIRLLRAKTVHFRINTFSAFARDQKRAPQAHQDEPPLLAKYCCKVSAATSQPGCNFGLLSWSCPLTCQLPTFPRKAYTAHEATAHATEPHGIRWSCSGFAVCTIPVAFAHRLAGKCENGAIPLRGWQMHATQAHIHVTQKLVRFKQNIHSVRIERSPIHGVSNEHVESLA